MAGIPSFSAGDVELLADSVRKTLEHLRDANERLGGSDAQMIEAGQRYSVLLEKLQAISNTPLHQRLDAAGRALDDVTERKAMLP